MNLVLRVKLKGEGTDLMREAKRLAMELQEFLFFSCGYEAADVWLTESPKPVDYKKIVMVGGGNEIQR